MVFALRGYQVQGVSDQDDCAPNGLEECRGRCVAFWHSEVLCGRGFVFVVDDIVIELDQEWSALGSFSEVVSREGDSGYG